MMRGIRSGKRIEAKEGAAHIPAMFPRLVALFIAVPLIELYLLFLIGERIGPLPTVGLVMVTGFIGASLARSQGLKVWRQIQTELQSGQMPAAELIDGLLVLIGGIVLLTPGLLTDLCGFALMIPAVRAVAKERLSRRFKIRADRFPPRPANDDVIDV